MVFMTIVVIIFTVLTVLFGLYAAKKYSDVAAFTSATTGCIAFGFLVAVLIYGAEAKQNKALMQAHLEKPTNYIYSQFAEHNELVTKAKVWQGTIFSFYNDVDLQTIDIDSISQKVIVDSKDSK